MPPKLIDDPDAQTEAKRYQQVASDAHVFTQPFGVSGGVTRTFGASAGLHALVDGILAVITACVSLAMKLTGVLAWRFAQHYEYFREWDTVSPLDPLQDIRARLTFTECDILTLMTRGYNDGRIAEILSLRRATFDSYLRHIYLAIGLVNRGQLRAWLAEHGNEFRR